MISYKELQLMKYKMKIHFSGETLELRDTDDKSRNINDLTDAELNILSYNDRKRNTLVNGLCLVECEKFSS